jgi:hypothetical protein
MAGCPVCSEPLALDGRALRFEHVPSLSAMGAERKGAWGWCTRCESCVLVTRDEEGHVIKWHGSAPVLPSWATEKRATAAVRKEDREKRQAAQRLADEATERNRSERR